MSWKRQAAIIKRRHKKMFGRTIKTTEIKRIWDAYVKNITDILIKGGEVRIDRYATIEVIGTPILKDRGFMERLKKGKMVLNGRLVSPKLNPRRRDVKYKIVYKHSMRNDVYFEACAALKKKVRTALKDTNNYFRIQ